MCKCCKKPLTLNNVGAVVQATVNLPLFDLEEIEKCILYYCKECGTSLTKEESAYINKLLEGGVIVENNLSN